jgi:DNA (cytosine-5)-methyltransferase 1
MPPPTHQRYIAPRRRDEATGSLFDAPDPERIVAPEDAHLRPWVSMAEALGWGMTARPTQPIPGGGTGSGGGDGRWVVQTNNFSAIARDADGGRSVEGSVRYERDVGAPSPTVTGATRLWHYVNGNQANAARRALDQPAPTLHFGHAMNYVAWERPACGCAWDHIDEGGFCACCDAHLNDPDGLYAMQGDGTHTLPGCPQHITGQARNSGPGAERGPRPLDAPSYTIRSAGSGSHPSGVEWVGERPATTVNGDPRISEPGRHDPEVSGSQQANAIRVSLGEALVLQSFPPDYPVRGSKSKQFEQVGNAVPPLLALHVLAAVTAPAEAELMRRVLASLDA